MSKYLLFVDVTPIERKTTVFHVLSAHHGNQLGRIAWYGAWRQYVFEPQANTVWSDGCLEEVVAFLKRLREERKAGA